MATVIRPYAGVDRAEGGEQPQTEAPLPAAEIAALFEALAGFEVVNTDANLMLDAHLLGERERLSWFDALIAEAAIHSRCTVLFSEDFSHGRRLTGVEVVNPLRDKRAPRPTPAQALNPMQVVRFAEARETFKAVLEPPTANPELAAFPSTSHW